MPDWPAWLTTLLIATNLLSLVALYFITRRMLKLRRQKKRAFAFSDYPIRKVKLEEVAPCFAMTPYGPSPDSEVRFIGGEGVVASLSDRESWVMAALAKGTKRIFEFGTCTGKTAHVFALNAAPDAEIHTLTLHPDDLAALEFGLGDDKHHRDVAAEESSFDTFFYNGQPTEKNIRQIFSDSKAYDESDLRGKVDLVFVDGAHTRTYVESDTRKALNMLAEDGVILWHDYKPDAPDVFAFLNDLSKQLPLVHIAETDLVMYRRTAAAGR
ncbi:MAG: class I SAM-dependent methyltransferase [Nisaea sp.]|uniref:class I SAM-dependent methyltransferase n=1 Tax=Nisaea sp. TaxID=2024842 RepID=UPI001B0CC3CE|nr:class I SAM-dependent methyltransferase [Nisaea sp.]MBO6560147.1 class I SAM-dependent methyltransferase [Nisaea sp.]